MRRFIGLLFFTLGAVEANASYVIGSISCADRFAVSQTMASFSGQAHFYSDPRSVPGNAALVRQWQKSGYLLYTDTLEVGNSPFSVGIREAKKNIRPIESLDEVPKVQGVFLSDYLLASRYHNGTRGLVRMSLMDGQVVAAKTLYNPKNEAAVFEEIRGAQLASDLGIGPKFHGYSIDGNGYYVLVMDVVPGDHKNMPVNWNSFLDLEEIFKRLESIGQKELGDFQPYRNAQGRLVLIDSGSVVPSSRRPSKLSSSEKAYARMDLIVAAPAELRKKYMTWLKGVDPAGHREILLQLRQLLESASQD